MVEADAAFLDAIAEKAELAEHRAGFDAEAEQRYARIVETGETIPWAKMRSYLEERVAGKSTRRPTPGKLARRR
ncbi:CopG family transcriptional regulator [Rhodanobacter glycinis]|uniref:CopG family transcriptional regulator n=1 Tax=Rhodanobacter glycinis TaxID=582702 RepID=A0A5B9E5A3_9GAMM|nr:CopG family transcriptional regulator [Rhodanobacter glycinis]